MVYQSVLIGHSKSDVYSGFEGKKMNSAFQIELATGRGAYDSKKNGGKYDGLNVLAILLQEPTSLPKDKAPWIIPSEYRESDARTHQKQKANGKYWLLTADIDSGNITFAVVKGAITDLFGKDQLVRIYSTGSATANCRKWRILIPLDRPLEPERWQLWQASLNTWLIERGITPDRVLERCGQLVYLPNVPQSHRGVDGEPLFYEDELSGNDLLTESSSQTWADWLALQTTIANEHDRAVKDFQEERLKNPKKLKGDSAIEEFNKAYSIDGLLAEYGYVASPNGRDWRSKNQSNKSYATRNHGEYWTSLSQSDTDSGLGRICSSGTGCFGDAFDLFCFYEHGNDQSKAIKELTQ